MSNVSGATKYFPTANEGFTTTVGVGGVTSGGTTIPLVGVAGLTDGSVFVGIIEPGATNQQTFTGIVDVAGSQITNVVWTRGTNAAHATGATVVDYVTGTAINLITTGLLKEHAQSGLHTKVNGNTIPAASDTIALVSATQTLTGKTISGGSNTITNIPTSALVLSTAQSMFTVGSSSTTSGAFGNLADAVTTAVTVTVGASGLALVSFGAETWSSATSGFFNHIGVQVSGANTVAFGDERLDVFTKFDGTSGEKATYKTTLLTGLTPGSTTFTLGYECSGGTATFYNRQLAVVPL